MSSIDEVNNQYHEELLKNQEIKNIVEESNIEEETSFSQEVVQSSDNSLKEFGVDTESPDLFNSENDEGPNSDNLLGTSNEEEDDDLEIPAFLRRQKN